MIGDMIEGMRLQSKAQEDMENYLRTHKRADDLGKKKCVRCGFCCYMRPCVPTKEELIKISKFLKLSTKEMIEKMFLYDRIRGVNLIIPIRKCQKDIAGTFINFRRTYDKAHCIFFDEKTSKCKIHKVKPKMAKDTGCWDDKEHKLPALSDKDLKELGIDLNVFEEEE